MSSSGGVAVSGSKSFVGLRSYYEGKIDSLEIILSDKEHNLRRLEAQRNDLNAKVRRLRDEVDRLHDAGSYIGEVVKVMGKNKVLCKVQPDGKYVTNIGADIDIAKLTTGTRVALRNDSYTLHKILPTKVDPLVSLMRVEKVPDATYDMVGGLDKQVREMKEVIELPIKHPELFEALGIAQPKGVIMFGPPGTGKTLLARAAAHHTDCFAGDALVTVNGYTMRIDSIHAGESSWSFDESKKHLVPSSVALVVDRGEKECIQLVFEDGRKIVCTKEHRFMTTAGWKQAQELVRGEFEVLFGPKYPELSIGVGEDAKWVLNVDKACFDVRSTANAARTMAFMRILGIALSDGSICEKQTHLYLGHELDVRAVNHDIMLLTGVEPTFTLTHTTHSKHGCYKGAIPLALHQLILAVGIPSGDRHENGYTLPEFLSASDCPEIVVRWFLQGLFSGDGQTLSLTKPAGGKSVQFRSLGFSWSSKNTSQALEKHRTIMQTLKNLLEHAGIPGVNKTTESVRSQDLVEHNFTFDIGSTPVFEDYVGFPYCIHKAMRLTVGAACIRAKSKADGMKDWLYAEYLKMKVGSRIHNGGYDQLLAKCKAQCPDYVPSAVPSVSALRTLFSRRERADGEREERGTTMNQLHWLEEHHGLTLFNSSLESGQENDSDSSSSSSSSSASAAGEVVYSVKRGGGIPCFTMKAVRCLSAGDKRTFDLQMTGNNPSFVVNAAVVHNCTFIRVSGSELVQKYIGEGSRMVREIFVMARQHSPSIIFMDEVDSIGGTRLDSGSGGDSEVQRTMLELLNQLDGFEPSQNIKVLMATNRIDILDPALLRPGRIDRKIEFPNPNEAARLHILKIHSRKMNLMRGINLRKVSRKMMGASGAEMKAVCTEAGMFALRERRVHVTQEDFEMAVTKVLRKDAEKDMSQAQFWK